MSSNPRLWKLLFSTLSSDHSGELVLLARVGRGYAPLLAPAGRGVGIDPPQLRQRFVL